MTVYDLRCECFINPLGIDVTKPCLSWVIESGQRGEIETAYQVLVASTAESLTADKGDLWDSGKVASDAIGTGDLCGPNTAVRGGTVFLESALLGNSRWPSVRVEPTGVLGGDSCQRRLERLLDRGTSWNALGQPTWRPREGAVVCGRRPSHFGTSGWKAGPLKYRRPAADGTGRWLYFACRNRDAFGRFDTDPGRH